MAGGEKEALRSAAGGLMMRLVEMACLSAGEGGSTAGLQALGAADGDGLTLLHCAAALGFVEVVQLLLARGPAGASMPPDAADNEGCTAMHWACAHGHPLVVDALLKAGGKQLANRDGLTPLDVWLREKAATSDDIGLTLVMDSFNTLGPNPAMKLLVLFLGTLTSGPSLAQRSAVLPARAAAMAARACLPPPQDPPPRAAAVAAAAPASARASRHVQARRSAVRC